MNTIIKFGVAALAAGAFLPLPIKAQTPDTFTRHGLPIPGAYFKNKQSQRPATIAVTRSDKILGGQKQPMSKAGNKHTKRVVPKSNH
jgi:hypothetical protein